MAFTVALVLLIVTSVFLFVLTALAQQASRSARQSRQDSERYVRLGDLFEMDVYSAAKRQLEEQARRQMAEIVQ